MVRNLACRRVRLVGDGNARCARVMGILHDLDRAARVPGQTEADDHIPRAHAQQLLKHLAGRRGADETDIVKHVAQIEVQKRRQRRRRAHADNIDGLRFQHCLHARGHFAAAERFARHADRVDVPLQNGGHHVLIAQPVVRDLNALDAGQLVSYQFLQGFLHAGVAVEAKLDRKAHNRRLRDLDHLAEPAGRHERRLVIGFQNIICDPLLSFGEGRKIASDLHQNVIHTDSPFIGKFWIFPARRAEKTLYYDTRFFVILQV